MTVDVLLGDLVDAWMAWDRFPGAERTTRRKSVAAAALRLDDRRLHDSVAALRHAGTPLDRAVLVAAKEQGVGDG